jgi:hypothetical protein
MHRPHDGEERAHVDFPIREDRDHLGHIELEITPADVGVD